MKQHFSKYLVGILFLGFLVLIPFYKSEAIMMPTLDSTTDYSGGTTVSSGVSSPFTLNPTVFVNRSGSNINLFYSSTVSWPASTWNANSIRGIWNSSTGSYTADSKYRDYIISYPTYLSIMNDIDRGLSTTNDINTGKSENAQKGYVGDMCYTNSSTNEVIRRAQAGTKCDYTKLTVNILDSSSNNVGSSIDSPWGLPTLIESLGSSTNGSSYYLSNVLVNGTSGLPVGNYTANFSTSPGVYFIEEYCASGWNTAGTSCGLFGLGAVQTNVYSKTWPLVASVPFTVSPAPTVLAPSGSISTTGCSIASGASTCASTVSWQVINQNIDSGTYTDIFHTYGNINSVGDQPVNGTAATSGTVNTTMQYGSNTLWLENNLYKGVGTKTFLYGSATYNAQCVLNTSWDGTKCAPALATVNVGAKATVTGTAQKSISVAKYKPSYIEWFSTNATNCSCDDGKGNDCFNQYPLNCNPAVDPTDPASVNPCIYTKFRDTNTTQNKITVYPRETTKFSVSCK